MKHSEVSGISTSKRKHWAPSSWAESGVGPVSRPWPEGGRHPEPVGQAGAPTQRASEGSPRMQTTLRPRQTRRLAAPDQNWHPPSHAASVCATDRTGPGRPGCRRNRCWTETTWLFLKTGVRLTCKQISGTKREEARPQQEQAKPHSK